MPTTLPGDWWSAVWDALGAPAVALDPGRWFPRPGSGSGGWDAPPWLVPLLVAGLSALVVAWALARLERRACDRLLATTCLAAESAGWVHWLDHGDALDWVRHGDVRRREHHLSVLLPVTALQWLTFRQALARLPATVGTDAAGEPVAVVPQRGRWGWRPRGWGGRVHLHMWQVQGGDLVDPRVDGDWMPRWMVGRTMPATWARMRVPVRLPEFPASVVGWHLNQEEYRRRWALTRLPSATVP